MSENQNKLDLLLNARAESWQRVLEGKIKVEDFIFGSFNFLRQYRLNPDPKAHEKEAILFNYLYWHICIEKKFLIENELIKIGMGNDSFFNNVIELYSKRRDQMVRRYIQDKHDTIKEGYLVNPNLVEIITTNNTIFYCLPETAKKLKTPMISQKKSRNAYYLSLLTLKKAEK